MSDEQPFVFDLTVKEVNQLAKECAAEFGIDHGKAAQVILATIDYLWNSQ